jgi:predicted small metal-binding protein
MKKSLSCRDMGDLTCTFEARSERNEEIKDALIGHIALYHPEKMKNFSGRGKNEMIHIMDRKLREKVESLVLF